VDTNRFDRVTKFLADRKARRAALQGGSIGLAAALGSRALAQDGTPQVATPAADPNDPHPSADADADAATVHPEFLFVQPFASGSWSPKQGEAGTYTLALTGAATQTVYFSDRPKRVVGLSPMQDFLDGLGFTPANPPNAALVAHTGEGVQEVLVVELLNPIYDGNGTLTYDAHVLADYGETGLAHLAQQQADHGFPAAFTEGSLFIDSTSCTDPPLACYANGQLVGTTTLPMCWHAPDSTCYPCDDRPTGAAMVCLDDLFDACSQIDPQSGRISNICTGEVEG
jgi:hypothetical protein